jgi:hypothetical protein
LLPSLEQEKHLRLLNLTKMIRELLVNTKLLTVFRVYENEQLRASQMEKNLVPLASVAADLP